MKAVASQVLSKIGITLLLAVGYACLLAVPRWHALYSAPLGMWLDPRRCGEVSLIAGVVLTLAAALLAVRASRGLAGWRRGLPALVVLIGALGLLAWIAPSLLQWYGAYATREVRWQNGDALLSGTVFIPRGTGPHPGVVLIHGTSPGLRSGYRFYADRFARLGYAALIYDKRGCGHSSGELEFAGLGDLANDALGGYRLLCGLPQVADEAVGFWGYSQGGALAPLAANRAGDAAFVICLSGPGLSLGEQMLHCNQKRLFNASSEDRALAARLRQAVWDCYYDRGQYPQLYQDLQAARGRDWYQTAGFPPKLADPEQALVQDESPFSWMGRYMNYDPVPALVELDCPLLMFYGSADTIVPPEESIRRISWAFGREVRSENLMPKADEPFSVISLREGAEIHLYPGVGHALYGTEPSGVPELPGFATGYLADLEDWLMERQKAETVGTLSS